MGKIFIEEIEQKYNIKVEDQLKELLSFCEEEPIIFHDERRLLSIDEILNYMNELKTEDENIIPLVDCYDNDYLIYDIKLKTFMFYYIVDGMKYNEISNINEYIELIKKYEK